LTVYYHGGPPGLCRILPPSTTGAKGLGDFGNPMCRRDRVYVTTDYDAALLFAAGSAALCAVVYEVTPIGGLAPDPDCYTPGMSWECQEAAVVRVHRPKKKRLARALAVLLEDT